MSARRVAVPLGVAAAVLLGGVAQVAASRGRLGAVDLLLTSQFTWVLACFTVAWVWSAGRPGSGAAGGAAVAVAMVACYYLGQWWADGWVSASSQLVRSSGAAWFVAAAAGGALVGALGGLAARRDRSTACAVGWCTAGLLVSAGPAASLLRDRTAVTGSGVVAVVVLGAVGLLGVLASWRLCGASRTARGLAVGCAACVVLIGGLFLAQRTVLYVTF